MIYNASGSVVNNCLVYTSSNLIIRTNDYLDGVHPSENISLEASAYLYNSGPIAANKYLYFFQDGTVMWVDYTSSSRSYYTVYTP